MPLFTNKKLGQAKNSLGRLLKNTRLKHKLKLTHIEEYTHIRQSYIAAIEEDNWQSLPSIDYTKKFILTYAKFLELDLEKIKNRFEIEAKYYFPDNYQISKDNISNRLKRTLIITPKTLAITTFFSLLLIIGIYTYYQINHFMQTPTLQIAEPADYIEVSVNKIQITGQTDPNNTIYINNQPLTIDKNGNFSTPVQLKSGYNIIKVTAENKIGRTTTATKVVVANLNQTDQPTNQIDLSISALDSDIWVRIKTADNQIIFDDTILRNQTKSFTSEHTLYLTTTNAGATSITINNQPLGIIGQNQEIIEDLQISSQPNSNNI
ncbi:DUF4115 domain-containing protein [Patescibacteria group bacterium]|nr:DUF4115 domain-containing protein [Patescibacteria group bacterium]